MKQFSKPTIEVQINKNTGEIRINTKNGFLVIPQNKVFALHKVLKEVVKELEKEGLLVNVFGKKMKL